MRLTIEKLVYGGSGLARTDKGVIFVPRTAPGDVVEAEITEQKKDYATARLVKVLEPSSDRQQPFCPNYQTAGCCHWQHIRYDRQVDHKEAIIRESLERIGHLGWTGPIKRILGPDRNYRLRATFQVVNGRVGFAMEKTNDVVPITECASLVPELNDFIPYANSILERGITEVHAVSGPAIAANFVFEDGHVKRILRGDSPVFQVDGTQYRLSADSFFQPNRFLLVPLINEVISQVGPSAKHVLELYAGTGFFSLPLARISTEVISVEENNKAVRYGRENVQMNKVSNLRFVVGDVIATLKAADSRPDVVVLDPPRAGCGVIGAQQIARLKPRRIVYVSCNPSTFAREARTFVSAGYELKQVTLIDQFPNTYHSEMVGQFDRVVA